jgi:glycosyltransferase involved in cell wall biosynthesis
VKIAQVTPYFYPVEGGVERHVYGLSRGLAERGHEVHVFTYIGDRNGGKFCGRECIDGIEVKRFNSVFTIGEFARLWPGVVRELLKGKFDVVHTHVYRHPHSDLSLLASKVSGCRSILTAHSPFPPLTMRKTLTRLAIPLYDSTFGHFSLRRFDTVISLTKSEAEKLSSLGIDHSKLVTIPHGVDPKHFEDVDTESFLTRFDLKDKRFILYLGRINRIKGIEYLLHAFSLIFAKHKEFYLVIAGGVTEREEEEYMQKLLIETRQLGLSKNVLFTGPLSEDDKLAAYRSCSAFVLPSIYEPYGIVLLEAAAHGKPLVAANSDGPASIIEEGVNGILVEPRNSLALAESLIHIIEDEDYARRIGMAAKAMAYEHTWKKVIDSVESVYKGKIIVSL